MFKYVLVALLIALSSCAPTQPVAIMEPSFVASADSGYKTYIPEAGAVMIEVESFEEADVAQTIAHLKRLDDGKRQIWIRIDSYGGALNSGMDLIQAIESIRSPVVCVADNKAMSMGFFLLQGCPTRVMTKRTVLMLHEPAAGAQGNQHELANQAKYLKAFTRQLIALCDRMNILPDDLEKKLAEGEWVLNWKEAVEVEAVDGLIEPRELPKLEETPAAPQNNLFQQLF